MNPELMKAAGFGKEVDAYQKKQCPFCNIHVKHESFRNPKSIREFEISGLCQECQDATFGRD